MILSFITHYTNSFNIIKVANDSHLYWLLKYALNHFYFHWVWSVLHKKLCPNKSCFHWSCYIFILRLFRLELSMFYIYLCFSFCYCSILEYYKICVEYFPKILSRSDKYCLFSGFIHKVHAIAEINQFMIGRSETRNKSYKLYNWQKIKESTIIFFWFFFSVWLHCGKSV